MAIVDRAVPVGRLVYPLYYRGKGRATYKVAMLIIRLIVSLQL